MPGLRIQWVLGPVWAKTKEQLQKDVINGVNPITKKPVMQEIADKLILLAVGTTNKEAISVSDHTAKMPGAPPAVEGAAPAAKPKQPPGGMMGSSIAIIVTGGTNNNYYSIGGMRYSQSVQIDPWR